MATLNDAALWVKIAGGSIAAIVAVVGLPAAFLQFGKTRAEITKLRLEARKLSGEVSGEHIGVGASTINLDLGNSRNTSVSIRTDGGLAGPLLLITDFIVAFVTYNAVSILIEFVSGPLNGFVISEGSLLLRGLVFGAMFIPVYANGRQVRVLLREIADRDSAESKGVASPERKENNPIAT